MSDHRSIPTLREVSALCAAVRDGQLDDEQGERLAQLLDTIGSAPRVTPTLAVRYPGQPERAAAAGLGCWDAVPGVALLEGGQQQRIDHGALDALSPRACRTETEGPANPYPGKGARHSR